MVNYKTEQSLFSFLFRINTVTFPFKKATKTLNTLSNCSILVAEYDSKENEFSQKGCSSSKCAEHGSN